MARIYLVVSIVGWTWCAIAAAAIFWKLRRNRSGER
jgi:hypothetical protein